MSESREIPAEPAQGNPPRAGSIGATGGLPGDNADPRAAELAPDEIADTVAMADVADTDDRADEGQAAGGQEEPGEGPGPVRAR